MPPPACPLPGSFRCSVTVDRPVPGPRPRGTTGFTWPLHRRRATSPAAMGWVAWRAAGESPPHRAASSRRQPSRRGRRPPSSGVRKLVVQLREASARSARGWSSITRSRDTSASGSRLGWMRCQSSDQNIFLSSTSSAWIDSPEFQIAAVPARTRSMRGVAASRRPAPGVIRTSARTHPVVSVRPSS